MPLSRLMALDFGQKRIGLALSDPLRIIARPYRTLPNLGFDNTLRELTLIIGTEQVERIVVGLPLNHEGEDTRQTALVRSFADKLAGAVGVPVVLHDERFTSEEANRELKRMGINPVEGRKMIDQIAATIILREYMEASHS